MKAVVEDKELFTFIATNEDTKEAFDDCDYFKGVNYDTFSEAQNAGISFAKKKQLN